MKYDKYILKSREDVLGEILIKGDKFDNFDGYIKLYEGIDGSKGNLLWFPDYRKGKRIFDREYLKYFIKMRSSDPDRPQLAERMLEAGIKEYDRLQLFLYAHGRMPTDWLYIERVSY